MAALIAFLGFGLFLAGLSLWNFGLNAWGTLCIIAGIFMMWGAAEAVR